MSDNEQNEQIDDHELKTGKFYCQEVVVHKIDSQKLKEFFLSKHDKFPSLFCKLNVALNFRDIDSLNDEQVEGVLAEYVAVLNELGHSVVGVLGVIKSSLIKRCGLQAIKAVRDESDTLLGKRVVEPVCCEKPIEEAPVIVEPLRASNFIKVHRGTVRGGQVVVVEDGDLLVVGNVACGAEVAASGSVTIVGRLDGRAHAGTGVEDTGFVFATKFNPELISINGVYSTSASLEEGENKLHLHRPTLAMFDKTQNKLAFTEGRV